MQEINVDFALKGGDSFNFVKNHHYHSDEVIDFFQVHATLNLIGVNFMNHQPDFWETNVVVPN